MFFLFLFNILVNCEYFDEFGVEYEDNSLNNLTGTSYLVFSDYVVPSNCEIINGGNRALDSSFRGAFEKLKNLSFSEGSSLKCIYPYAFSTCQFISLDLSNCNSLKSINQSICYDCPYLKTIKLPESITTINQYAFYLCQSLTDIKIPDSVKNIQQYAFRHCYNLSYVDISENSLLEQIGQDAFGSTIITSLYIPKNLNTLTNALVGLKLTEIIIHPENTKFEFYNNSLVFDGYALVYALATLNGTYTVPKEVTQVKPSAIRDTKYEYIIFPHEVQLSSWALGRNVNLKSIDYPEGNEEVYTSCFAYCRSLERVTLPSGIKTIGRSAFQSCTMLQTINIPDTVETIKSKAFTSCTSLIKIEFPSNLRVLEMGVFTQCSNLQININNNQNFIFEENMLFTNNGEVLNAYFGKEQNIELPDSCTTLGTSVFVGTPIETLTIGDVSTFTISDMAFMETNITTITFPDNLDSLTLSSQCFESCHKLVSLDLSKFQLIEIPSRAFYNCSQLSSFGTPSNLQLIADYAFYCCYELENFNFVQTITNISDYAFYSTKLSSIEIQFSEDFSVLGISAFENTKITSVKFDSKSSISSIPLRCFACCSELNELSLSNSITLINEEAFINCNKLKKVGLPQNIETIEIKAFYNCKKLSKVEFKQNCNLQTIKGQAFGNCPLLEEFDIPDGDNKFVFQNGVLTNTSGTEIYVYLPSSKNKYFVVPSKVTSIKPYAFQQCNTLEAVYIPDGTLKNIDIYAFEGCENLRAIYLPDSLEVVGFGAFLNCNNLQCGEVRVANEEIKQKVIRAQMPSNVFNENCPAIRQITCKNNNLGISRTSCMISLLFYVYASS